MSLFRQFYVMDGTYVAARDLTQAVEFWKQGSLMPRADDPKKIEHVGSGYIEGEDPHKEEKA